MCGTPEYLAPEIIANKGYNRAVDWWAVGVLIFEMRCGRSPFESKDQLTMFKRITCCDLHFPKVHVFTMCCYLVTWWSCIGGAVKRGWMGLHVAVNLLLFLFQDYTDQERDLIQNFLQVDITKRLGYMHGGVQKIKTHPYFKGINFERMLKEKVMSPFDPKVSGPSDSSNFERFPREDRKPDEWYV